MKELLVQLICADLHDRGYLTPVGFHADGSTKYVLTDKAVFELAADDVKKWAAA